MSTIINREMSMNFNNYDLQNVLRPHKFERNGKRNEFVPRVTHVVSVICNLYKVFYYIPYHTLV